MAGHSKWANIKHRKAAQDAKRGKVFTKMIREIEQDKSMTPMPIIALTANASSNDRILCEEAGMDEVVTKPFKQADLSEALTKWLPPKY